MCVSPSVALSTAQLAPISTSSSITDDAHLGYLFEGPVGARREAEAVTADHGSGMKG